ncbi:double-strand break repair helicase AddA [Paracoccus jiaweipingae]|uniref:double-strand break repair helicase AddA n=1 Tax=unclassified Paracoccus (in: a-proteobacteria) TaxID=2688777 RepID=UPI003792CCCF
MTDRAMDDASKRQVEAADPARSTWLTANAGSGKTRVLTDRVARLLLAGCAPERILCLTYTKAAATEMQNRLLSRLGKWAMLGDAALRAELAQLGETGTPDLAAARRLFAQAIETPGGLKVQTIHSFCAALLRRFPLEAGVPHGFSELDSRSADLIRAEIVEEMARDGVPELRDLVTLVSDDQLAGFLASVTAGGFDRAVSPDALLAALGLPAGFDTDTLLAQVFLGAEAGLMAALIPALQAKGGNDGKAAVKLAALDWTAPGPEALAVLENVLLFGPVKDKETGGLAAHAFTAKIGSFPTRPTQAALGEMLAPLNDLMRRVEAARPARLSLIAAQRSAALHRFGHAFMRQYNARKRDHGWLDFDDLITCTARLLAVSDLAQWVLWRLDGGIDHILVDEAQDTSPAQWQVIRRLTAEFTSGQGAVDRDRTLFVVGDPKQSIYSFQGADIRVFNEKRDEFDADFAAIQRPMQQTDLKHSFRSSPAVLALVDAVFQDAAAEGLGDRSEHKAFRAALPGRVDLWPPLPRPDKPEAGAWFDAVDLPAPDSEVVQLANAVAAQIRDMIGTPLHDAKTGVVRPLDAGDVLVLVQRRSALFAEVIRACKSAGLPVAGADRLKLAAELAVRDIRALLAFLATPEDDLSLAAVLRSPLFGLSEDDLFRLATGRRKGQYLWERLRDSAAHQDSRAVLSDMLDNAGYLRPYELISRLLVRHRGRDRLLSRLGPEAEDGLDELLSQALGYERVEVPSLTGFLVWLTGDDVEVKRQPGSSGGMVRVMTVHGSKGLESPVVILPDTGKRRAAQEAALLAQDDGPVLWRGRKDERPPQVAGAAETQRQRHEEERRRLLYVALTRAESWLIVAAAGDLGTGPDSWHAMVAAGMDRAALPEARLPCPWGGQIRRLSHGDWPELAPAQGQVAPGLADLPDWVRKLPPGMARRPRPVAATALGGAKALAGSAPDPDAMLRGTRLHLLLELLPGKPRPDWPGLAQAALAGAEGGLPDIATQTALLDEVSALLDARQVATALALPDDADVLTEVALTAPLPGGGVLNGVVDRLLVWPDRVVVMDYKSNAQVPDSPDAVPEGILRQMAAYRLAAQQIWPGRAVSGQILWTAARQVMDLPDALLDRVSDNLAGLRA